MSEHQSTENVRPKDLREQVDRRGLFAWAATLAGAVVAWLMGGGSAEATHSPGTGGPANSDGQALHVDSVNTGTQRTFLVADVNGNPPLVSFNGTGPFSLGQDDAMQGITRKNNAAGVHGHNRATTGSAVGLWGDTFSTTGTGVVGVAGLAGGLSVPPNVGVFGRAISDSGMGVRGQIPSSNLANTIAVYGENFSTNPGPGPGAGGFGVYGYSDKGHGVVGATGTAGGGAVIGSTNGVPNAHAGIFYGPLVVLGAKSAAVPHPDGGHRLLYCVESPESWFEDFGNATLVAGRAEVAIDVEFAGIADVSDYHVFLTPYGNTRGLHVANRTAKSFTVEENDRGNSETVFAWRIVAKRKDIVGERLARVVLPAEPKHPTSPAEVAAAEPRMVPAPKPRKHAH